jgi:hypothetical protein
MSSNELEQISKELDRIAALPLDEQIAEFTRIRDHLEVELNNSPGDSPNQNESQVR